MPRLKVCSHPGCSALTSKGRCENHSGPSASTPKAWATTTTSSSARGYGSRWRKLRALKLAEQPVCEACRRAMATTVDHIKPKARGGGDEWENLQSLCDPCHKAKTASEGGPGWLVPPTDPPPEGHP